MTSNDPDFTVLSETQVYKRYIKVVDRRVAFPPDGRQVAWDVAASAHFVLIVPYHSEDGTVTLIREYAQGPNKMVYGLPGGQIDPKKSSGRLETAKAELSEEAALKGGELVPLIPDEHPGIPELKWVSNLFAPYLVIDPVKDETPGHQDEEEFIEVHRLPLKEVQDLILAGNFMLPSAQAFWMALKYLQEHGYLDKVGFKPFS